MKIKGSVIILVLFSLNVFSQPLKVKVGIKAGISFANSKIVSQGNYPSIVPNRAGLTAGGFLNIYPGKNLMIQPAVMFVSKGGRYYDGLRMGYLEIPINVLYKPASQKGTYFFGGGFSPAFELNGDYYGYQPDMKKFDLGINVLAGYVFPIGFSINLGYTHGILDISNEETYSLRNRYFAITAGYEF